MLASLDVFVSVFQSPEGRTENSPGLQAWEGHAQRTRPAGRPNRDWSQRGDALLFAFHVRSRFQQILHTDFFAQAPHWAAPSATPTRCAGAILHTHSEGLPYELQGDSVGDAFPGLKAWAVLFSPFGRSGLGKQEQARSRVKQTRPKAALQA